MRANLIEHATIFKCMKITNMAKAPALPFIIRVEDYHYFSPVVEILKLLNPKIKVQELDTYYIEKARYYYAPYLGIVYEGRRPSNKTIKEMLTGRGKTKIYELLLGR